MKHLDDVQLNAWADNTLACDEQNLVSSHLEKCRLCREKALRLSHLCDTIKSLPALSADKALEKRIITAFRLEKKKADKAVKKEYGFFFRKTLGYSIVMAGIIAGLLLGQLINPLIRNVSDGKSLLCSGYEHIQENKSEDYLQNLLADNGGDLW